MEWPATRTTFSVVDLITALRKAYTIQLGHDPKQETIAVLAAQVALETGGGTACIQWNIGNFKANIGADFCRFATTEYINGQAQPMVCSFAVFQSLEQGCEQYLHSMYTHWDLAWPFAVAGDPKGFAQGLHDQKPYGYYTAPVALYIKGVQRWFDQYMKVPWDPPSAVDTLPAIPFIPDVLNS